MEKRHGPSFRSSHGISWLPHGPVGKGPGDSSNKRVGYGPMGYNGGILEI